MNLKFAQSIMDIPWLQSVKEVHPVLKLDLIRKLNHRIEQNLPDFWRHIDEAYISKE